jgi:hypothetical protein
MDARSSATLGILAAIALALPVPPAPTFALHSTGAVQLQTGGSDARYGLVPSAIQGRPILMVSLGATSTPGALQLTRLGDRLPAPGRYPIRSSWDQLERDTTAFHASFMPGTAESPLGWFHGESGWVTIAEVHGDRIAGEFEVRARGFTSANSDDEDQLVTVHGSFVASGDSTATAIASAW